MMKAKAMDGNRWIETEFVCTTEVGTPIEHRNARARFRRLCAQADVPRIVSAFMICDPRPRA